MNRRGDRIKWTAHTDTNDVVEASPKPKISRQDESECREQADKAPSNQPVVILVDGSNEQEIHEDRPFIVLFDASNGNQN